ncbi:MAG: right-handed parallel beta-helix repeat-containing protein, partial [Puniceicoccales bacterium]
MRRALTLSLSVSLSLLSLANASPPSEVDVNTPPTGASIDESVEQIYLRVDPTYILPEEADPTDAPFKTIQDAVNAAMQYLERDIPVRIGITPSIYRESITIPGNSLGALLVIEGDSALYTIITGSEPLTSHWSLVDKEKNIWRHSWTHDWGDFTLDQSWSSSQGPLAPQRLVSQSRAHSVALSWEPPGEGSDPTACYRIYRQRVGRTGQDYELVADEVRETTWEDTDLEPSTAFENNSYTYYVTAINKWGKESRPSGIVNSRARDPEGAGYPPYLVRRREQFFAGGLLGAPLVMVEKPEDLAIFGEIGSFYVSDGYLRDRSDGYVLVCLPEGETPDNTVIEASTNLNPGRKNASACLYIVDKPNLVLRNLSLVNSVQNGLHLDSCRNVLIEDVYASGNGGSGIDINVQRKLEPVSEAVSLRRIHARGNGGSGISASRLLNFRIEDCAVNGSNQRSFWNEQQNNPPYLWNRAGLLLSNAHRGLINNLEATANAAPGLWLDYNNRGIRIEDSLFQDNLPGGLKLSASQGPFVISGSQFVRNGVGLILANARDGLLEDNIFADNFEAQIEVLRLPARPVIDWSNQAEETVRTENWTWRDNIFSTQLVQPGISCLIKVPYAEWPDFYNTLKSSRNLWWIAFEPDQAAQLDALQINLSGWQMATGQDLDSRFADPKLTRNKGTRRYEPEPDSPAHDRANWTAIELPEDH